MQLVSPFEAGSALRKLTLSFECRPRLFKKIQAIVHKPLKRPERRLFGGKWKSPIIVLYLTFCFPTAPVLPGVLRKHCSGVDGRHPRTSHTSRSPSRHFLGALSFRTAGPSLWLPARRAQEREARRRKLPSSQTLRTRAK